MYIDLCCEKTKQACISYLNELYECRYLPTALWGYLTDKWTVMVLSMSGALCEWSPVVTLNTSRHKIEVNNYMIESGCISFLQC